MCQTYLWAAMLLLVLLGGCANTDHEIDFMPTSTLSATPNPIPSVTPGPSFGDSGFLSGEPCGPPCFYGIVPGTTTKSEVIQILNDMELLDRCSVIDNDQFTIDEEIGGWDCNGTRIYYRKNTEIVFSITYDLPEPVLLSDIIAVHGEPGFVNLLETGFAETPHRMATIFWMML